MAQSEYQVALRARGPKAPDWYDLQRLQELRDEYAKAQEESRRSSDRNLEGRARLAQDHAALLVGPKAANLRALSIKQLGQLSVEDLAKCQISAQSVQQLIVQESRAETLRKDTNEAAARVNRLTPFMEKLEAFAGARKL